jgi:hypothetical protein
MDADCRAGALKTDWTEPLLNMGPIVFIGWQIPEGTGRRT